MGSNDVQAAIQAATATLDEQLSTIFVPGSLSADARSGIRDVVAGCCEDLAARLAAAPPGGPACSLRAPAPESPRMHLPVTEAVTGGERYEVYPQDHGWVVRLPSKRFGTTFSSEETARDAADALNARADRGAAAWASAPPGEAEERWPRLGEERVGGDGLTWKACVKLDAADPPGLFASSWDTGERIDRTFPLSEWNTLSLAAPSGEAPAGLRERVVEAVTETLGNCHVYDMGDEDDRIVDVAEIAAEVADRPAAASPTGEAGDGGWLARVVEVAEQTWYSEGAKSVSRWNATQLRDKLRIVLGAGLSAVAPAPSEED